MQLRIYSQAFIQKPKTFRISSFSFLPFPTPLSNHTHHTLVVCYTILPNLFRSNQRPNQNPFVLSLSKDVFSAKFCAVFSKDHTTCVIFASFHQGKEEMKFVFIFALSLPFLCLHVFRKPGRNPQTHCGERASSSRQIGRASCRERV